jgi:hypothetical protein
MVIPFAFSRPWPSSQHAISTASHAIRNEGISFLLETDLAKFYVHARWSCFIRHLVGNGQTMVTLFLFLDHDHRHHPHFQQLFM